MRGLEYDTGIISNEVAGRVQDRNNWRSLVKTIDYLLQDKNNLCIQYCTL